MLPLLPPITRNVKLPKPANRLEFGVREEATPDTRPKSGKNGNVNPASQHCHPCRHHPTASAAASRAPSPAPVSVSPAIGSVGASGSVKVKRRLRPSALSTQIRPPCGSTRRRRCQADPRRMWRAPATSPRPSPESVPAATGSASRVRARSTLKKRSKTRAGRRPRCPRRCRARRARGAGRHGGWRGRTAMILLGAATARSAHPRCEGRGEAGLNVACRRALHHVEERVDVDPAAARRSLLPLVRDAAANARAGAEALLSMLNDYTDVAAKAKGNQGRRASRRRVDPRDLRPAQPHLRDTARPRGHRRASPPRSTTFSICGGISATTS